MKQHAHRALRAATAAALVISAALSPACSNRGGVAGQDAGAPAVAVLEPIPAPSGLLAEISIPSPDAAWKKARVAVGGPALFAPQSFSGLVAMGIGLPLTAIGEIDGNIPALGAVIDAPERPQPYAAVGVHVRVGERLIDQLTKGETARFTARLDPTSGVTLLDQKGGVAGPVAMGVLGNYLLIGRESADIGAAGPYIVRTLAKAPAASGGDVLIDVPDAALAGPGRRLMERLRDSMSRTSASIAPLLPLDRITAWLADVVPDLSHARISITLDAATAHLRASAVPRAGGGPATAAFRDLSVGDVGPLRALPEGTLLAFLDRDTAPRGAPDAVLAIERALPASLTKLDKSDRDALVEALRSVGEARGDYLAGGASFGGTGPVGFVRAPAPDADKLASALKNFTAILKRRSIKEWLSAEGFEVKVGKGVIEGVAGDVQRLTIARVRVAENGAERGAAKPAKSPAGASKAKEKDEKEKAKDGPSSDLPTSIDIYYQVRKDGLFASAGYAAQQGLSSLLAASEAPGRGFGAAPEVGSMLDALGPSVAFTIVLDPLRFIASRAGKPGAAPSAPLLIALGKGEGEKKDAGIGELWARVDVAVTAIQELVKNRGALSL